MAKPRCLRLRVVPITNVTNIKGLDAPFSATVGETPLYFQYSVAEIGDDLENQLLLLNISKRTNLQVYVHIHEWPDENNHLYPLGDVPENVLKTFFK